MSERVHYPLTSPQLSIWYTEKMYPGTSISNVAGTVRIKDSFNFDLLEKSINYFLKNNDGIRLKLCLNDKGFPEQYVSDYEHKHFEFMDFSHFEDPAKAMFEWNSQETLKPFELIESDLFRFVIIKLSDNDGGIYANIHHIISDAWSISVSCNMITGYYNEFRDNADGSYDETKASYISFILNEQLYKESNRYIKDKLFWEKQFEIPPEVSVLKSRTTNAISTLSKRKTFVAPKKFINKLRAYCAENRITPYPLFVSALAMYINRVSTKEDIVIGTPILNRLNQMEKNTVGMFISTIPLRMNVKSENTFSDFSKEILELCSTVYRHQRYPYDRILKYVRDKNGFSDNLFDIVLSYQNSKFTRDLEIDYSTRWHFSGHQSNSLTVHINDRDDDGTLIFDYDYHTDLYNEIEIEFIHQHMLTLLWHALDNPEKRLCKVEMLPENEKMRLLYEFNSTRADYPKNKTIHQLFEDQVMRTPDSVALIFEDKPYTYRELNQKANTLAWGLRERGLKPNDVAGILVSRSFEMISGILAILKAGGAYLPLEIESPDNRIDFIIRDSNVSLVLTDNSTDRRILSCDTVNVQNPLCYTSNMQNPGCCNKPHDLAYIIYTSGTSGEPKGVMIEHMSVNNFIGAVTKIMDFSVNSIVLSSTTVCFDIFVFEMFTSLLNGARLVLANELEKKIPKLTGELIARHKVNKLLTTPSKMRLLLSESNNLQRLEGLKEIMLGGEAFPQDLLLELKANLKAKIFNGYGPTETTVGVSFKELEANDRITVGKPMANTKFYVLDKNLGLVPIGIAGELYIGGAGLARGYNNRQELTDKSFIKSPFNAEERLYKTGDIAKWFPKGELDLLGRIDNQIKINGHRIELEEIKSHILKIPGTKNAIVIDQAAQNNKRMICAYLLSDEPRPLDTVRQYLSKVLPDYMIPSYIAYISNIPVTVNGKIDRDKLPKPLFNKDTVTFVKPETDTEKDICKIWQSVLNAKEISVNDIIFEIGGDSLDIITISSMITKKYNVNLPVTDVREVNTIRKMAQYIDQRNTASKQANKNLCLLKNGNTNLFFIHAGNGEISNYIDLSNLLSDELACWAIKMDFEGYYPADLSVHDLADQYIRCIKSIQPEGPYYLAGWSIGGTIAFEMACILENINEEIGFIGLIDSLAPQLWVNTDQFTPEGELAFIRDVLKTDLSADFADLSTDLTVEAVWDAFVEAASHKEHGFDEIKTLIPHDIRTMIPRFESSGIEDVLRYINGIRSLHIMRALYYPQKKIRSETYLFNAVEDKANTDDNYNKWCRYCQHKMRKIDISADHYSIFKKPGILKLSQSINNIIDLEEVIQKSV